MSLGLALHPHLGAYIGHGALQEERDGNEEHGRTCRDGEHKQTETRPNPAGGSRELQSLCWAHPSPLPCFAMHNPQQSIPAVHRRTTQA